MNDQVPMIGAACVGLVVGWMANRAFHEAKEVNVAWLGAMLAVLGGSAIAAYLQRTGVLFGAYGVGLAVAFFLRVLTFSPWAKAVSKRVVRILGPSK